MHAFFMKRLVFLNAFINFKVLFLYLIIGCKNKIFHAVPTYSMLKNTLRVKENADISKFGKLLIYLKHKSEGNEVKKSKILS